MNYDNWKLETPPQFQDDDEDTYCHECSKVMEYNRISNLCPKCIEDETN
jgi:Zn finger protein HypA/HybF involved in hydrogenase expression